MQNPPYRKPCLGSSGSFAGPFFNNFKSGSIPSLTYPLYINTTLVTDYEGGSPIPPYERWTRDSSGPESCEIHFCCDPTEEDCSGTVSCSAWPLPYPTQTFAQSGSASINLCSNVRSFKNVMARKFWQGIYGYFSKEIDNGPDTSCVSGSNPNAQLQTYRSYQSTPDRTKYRTIAASSTYTKTDDTGTETDTISFSQTIDQNSGIYTTNDLSISPNNLGNNVFLGNRAIPSMPIAFWNWDEVVGRMLTPVSSVYNYINYASNGMDVYLSCTPFGSMTPSDVLIETLSWDLGAGTFSRTAYMLGIDCSQLTTFTETVSLSNTSIDYESVETDYESGDTSSGYVVQDTITINVTGDLSDAYADGDVKSEVESNLLSTWNLADDIQYPWRTDLVVSIAPLVIRDEVLNNNFNDAPYVTDYGSPVPNPPGTIGAGDSIGTTDWFGLCGGITNPDPNSGNAQTPMGLTVNSGDVVDNTPGGGVCGPVSSATYRGTLPPGISFDSTTGRVYGTASATGNYGVTVATTSPPCVTGNIIGAPLASGGNWFDFGFLDYRGCCYMPPDNPGFMSWDWYQVGWGQSLATFNGNTRSNLPPATTHWDNWWESQNKPQGAWLFFNDVGSYYGPGCISSDGQPSGIFNADALWACKYAEALDVWPSQNFARPAGLDKFTYDEDNGVYCVTTFTGSTVYLSTYDLNVPTISDTSGYWGGESVGGFWTISSYASGTASLGSKIYNLPSGWTNASGDESTSFGKLRFPTCPSLLGRTIISPDFSGSVMTFGTAQPTFGMLSASNQEIVDYYDKHMNLLNSSVTATRIDDSHFSSSVVQHSASYVSIHGTPAYYMNDSDPKGDYVYLTWMSDFRNAGEFGRLSGSVDCSGTQIALPTSNFGGGPVENTFANFEQSASCLRLTGCGRRIVCISPNGESFPNGVTYPFPTLLAGGASPSASPNKFYFDEIYGTKWWGSVQQTMVDLLWQQPHPPCGFTVNCDGSDPSCVQEILVWRMDGEDNGFTALCEVNNDEDITDPDTLDEIIKHHRYYAYHPLVEQRTSLPCNYGYGQNECAPSLPAGIQIGWNSPVTGSGGSVAFPPVPPGITSTGNPNIAITAWWIHSLMCASVTSPDGCPFVYNLPGC